MNTRKLNTRKRNKGIGGIYFHEYLKCFAREFHFVSNDYYGPNLLPTGYDETQVNWAKGYLTTESFEIPHIWCI
ncbi:hypothetical protein [Bacillus sp. T3]|uniref:hypothetical protein n=1 Tax=Bacillus sp. T3 TaxID=467262 RepID=UPI0029813B06|nr:hypothetical protein [Bacillus sp. T3]